MQEAGVDLDAVIEISVPDDEIVRRMSGRRVHLASGRTYHLIFNPPKVEGKDDVTGEDLIQRADDNETTVRNRLSTYHDQTEVLTKYYGEGSGPKLITVDGTQSIEGVKDAISAEIGRLA